MLYEHFKQVLLRSLKTSGLPAQCLELVITETALLDHAGPPLERLDEIRTLGVGVAMDRLRHGILIP
jgi:EAL domain-containing protein (putative c-di-GMP-specific phosphodiesterase class I)